MTRERKIDAIIDAARQQRFSDDIEDIEMFTYIMKDGLGNEVVKEDRFDYVDLTTFPASVHLIFGGEDNIGAWIPLHSLTDESIDRLYKCIN